MRLLLLLWLATIGFAIARFTLPVTGEINNDDIFKDLAHVFVGGLFGAAIRATIEARTLFGLKWDCTCNAKPFLCEDIKKASDEADFACVFLWALAIGLTVLEVVAFLVRRAGGA